MPADTAADTAAGTAAGNADELPLEAKVAFLRRPENYPHAVGPVEAVETHLSWVFLTGTEAYKLKKPVRTDFLDLRSAEQRRHNAEQEVRLNRRLAPWVYLGVVALTVGADSGLQIGRAGQTVDWLVHMRRLPTDRMLDIAIRDATVDDETLAKAAELLARFYRDNPLPDVDPAGYREHLRRAVATNHDLLAEGLAEWLNGRDRERAAAIHRAQFELLEGDSGLFDRRVAAGRIVEGHGDLRPEHICLVREPVVIDCLEFDREHRITDPVDEVTFLDMECTRLRAPEVGRVFFDTYCRVAGDDPPARLVAFYRCYRASLRARLATWHLQDPDVADTRKWTERTQLYLAIAEEAAAGLG